MATKLLSLAIASALFFPLGGTVLELPIEGRADPAKLAAATRLLEFETWDCAKHPAEDPGKIQLLTCAVCGKAMAKVDPEVDAKTERHLRFEVNGGCARVITGPWTGIGLLRQSTIERAIEHAGASLRTTAWSLRGHVLLEVGAAKADAETEPGGEAAAKGQAKASASDAAAKTAAKNDNGRPSTLRADGTAEPDAKALVKALSAFGKVETGPKGSPVLVRLTEQKDGHDRAALVAAVESAGYALEDMLWIVNQCSGELVTISNSTRAARARRHGRSAAAIP